MTAFPKFVSGCLAFVCLEWHKHLNEELKEELKKLPQRVFPTVHSMDACGGIPAQIIVSFLFTSSSFST
jgi:hypothetical protein